MDFVLLFISRTALLATADPEIEILSQPQLTLEKTLKRSKRTKPYFCFLHDTSRIFCQSTQFPSRCGQQLKDGGQKSCDTVPLKGQCHEIFDTFLLINRLLTINRLTRFCELFSFSRRYSLQSF